MSNIYRRSFNILLIVCIYLIPRIGFSAEAPSGAAAMSKMQIGLSLIYVMTLSGGSSSSTATATAASAANSTEKTSAIGLGLEFLFNPSIVPGLWLGFEWANFRGYGEDILTSTATTTNQQTSYEVALTPKMLLGRYFFYKQIYAIGGLGLMGNKTLSQTVVDPLTTEVYTSYNRIAFEVGAGTLFNVYNNINIEPRVKMYLAFKKEDAVIRELGSFIIFAPSIQASINF